MGGPSVGDGGGDPTVNRPDVSSADQHEARPSHQVKVASGWPVSWRPTMTERWRALGGSAEQASEFARAGWPAKEVVAAAQAVGATAGLVPPDGDRSHHQAFGDALSDLLTGARPPVPPNAILAMDRTRALQVEERWVLVAMDDHVSVSRYRRTQNEGWSITGERQHQDAETAFAETPALHRVDTATRTLFHAPHMKAADIVALLQARTRDLRARPHDAEIVANDDEWLVDSLADMLGDTEHRITQCWVNGERLVAVNVGRRWHLLRFDEDEETFHSDRTICESTWNSESGGAPVSWDGGNAIRLLAPNVIEDHQWGDLGTEHVVAPAPRTPAGWAKVITDWVVRLQLETPAALTLEPWPDTGLFEAWADVPVSLSIDVDDAVREAIRRRLARDSGLYRATRDALRRPYGIRGQLLSATLTECAHSGMVDDLLSDAWTNEAGSTGPDVSPSGAAPSRP